MMFVSQLNIAQVLEATLPERKSDPCDVNDSSSSPVLSTASHVEHILSKVHWNRKQLPQLRLADLDAFDQYLLGATALDVSIMITFQAVPTPNPTAAAGISSTEVVHGKTNRYKYC